MQDGPLMRVGRKEGREGTRATFHAEATVRAEHCLSVCSEGHLCHLEGTQPCSRPSTAAWKERAWEKASAAGGTGVEGTWKPQVLTMLVSSDGGPQNKEGKDGGCLHSPLAPDC